ncbi:TMEM175 family protein [Oceanivirga salmonicida]|uniref:TMEM175 family protein n=1 Tax=Oceanivirga salmonicida TaxID=1769291 RepID=UPI0012E2CD07|nr:TMEM175 family protein [Oceanivirga salmonicida]
MKKQRLEAFSDGVLAIIITIMVLEFKAPKGHDFKDLVEVMPIFISYVSSFFFISIYWINHHNLLQATTKVNSNILWSNLHLLFWLSLIPFATSWLGRREIYNAPVILYSTILFLSRITYSRLAYNIAKNEGENSHLSKALNNNKKGRLITFLNFLAIIIAFYNPLFTSIFLILVAISWIIPNKQIEKAYHLMTNK